MLNYLEFMETLQRLLREYGGIVTRRQTDAAGIEPHLLTRWVREGRLERVQRGVYRRPEAPLLAEEGWLEVGLRIPYAVLCLRSALAYHGLTTYIPKAVDIAVPQNRYSPKLEYPPVRVHYFSPSTYDYGQQVVKIEGHPLKVYGPEKTLADLLRFAGRYGEDLFLEGLKNYLARRRPRPDLFKLLEAARVCRVERRLRPILQALTYSTET